MQGGKTMKLFARIILFVVGGVLLYLSISSIIQNWSLIQVTGWDEFFKADTLNAVLSIASQAFFALCGLYAIYTGLRGRASFIGFVAAVILVVIVVFKTINFVKSDIEKNFDNIFQLVLSFLMPVGFAAGVLMLTVEGKHKQ